MAGRSPRDASDSVPFLHSNRRQRESLGRKWHIDIFEKSPAGNTANSVGGFEKVVTGLAAMFAAEGIGEYKWLGELTRAHEKSGAIKIPITFGRHDFHRFGSYGLKRLILVGEVL